MKLRCRGWAALGLALWFPAKGMAAPPAVAPAAPVTALAPPAERITFELRFPAEKGGGKAVGTAGTIEYQRDDFATATGAVEIKYQDYDIKADTVSVDLGTKLITALGHVVIDQGPRRMAGNQATFDLETKTGTLQDASAYLEPEYYFSGKIIRKTGDDTYEVEHGIFTSCKGDAPAWSFHLSHANLQVEGYAHIRNLTLRVRKAPVFYLPYLLWPVKRERASGLLVPNIGYTNLRGEYLGLSYYQVLGRSYDTTLLVDGYSKGYYGIGDEFRYRPTAGTKGIFHGYIVHDPVTNEARWKVLLDQETTDLPWGMRGVVNYRDYSDFNFFRDFERDLRQTTQRTLYSQGFVTGNWGAQSLNLIVDNRETFISEGLTVRQEKLPSAEYRLRSLRLFGAPLYLDMVSSASYLLLDRGANYSGKYSRIDVAPKISAPLSKIPWFSLSLNAGGHATFYGDSLNATATAFTGQSLTRVLPTGGLDAVGPSISRIFDAGGYKIKHVIEPRWQYSYLGTFDEANAVPLFDETDTQPSTNIGRFTLVNRILARPNVKSAVAAKPGAPAAATPAAGGAPASAAAAPATSSADVASGTGSPAVAAVTVDGAVAATTPPAPAASDAATAAAAAAATPTASGAIAAAAPAAAAAAVPAEGAREVLALELSRSYSFDTTQPLEISRLGEKSQFGAVTALVRLTPSVRTNLRAQVSYSPLLKGLQSTQLTGQYGFGRGNAGLSWFTRYDPELSTKQQDQIGLNGGIALWPGRLRLDAQINYDIQNAQLQQDRFVMTYTSQCWGMRIEYRDFQATNYRQHDWRFAISLKNVGDVLDFGVGDSQGSTTP